MEPCPTHTNPAKKKPPAVHPRREEGTRRKEARPPLQAATWRKMAQGPRTPLNPKLDPRKEHMSTEQQLQTLAHELGTALQRITALENTLGCLTMLAMRQLPASQRATWGDGIAALAATAEKHGDIASATLLTELHRSAAQSGRG